MNKNQIETRLGKAHDKYITYITALAEDFSEKELRPFCVKHNLTFLVGGGWGYIFLTLGKGNILHDFDQIPKFKWVVDFLNIDIPGSRDVFADFMPCFAEKLPEERAKYYKKATGA